jgi:ABC-2 type transport system permease protein
MVSKRIRSVIKREVKIKLGKGFVISTIFIPIIMAAIVGIQLLLGGMKSDSKADITFIMANDPAMESLLRSDLSNADFVKSGLYTISYKQMASDKTAGYIADQQKDLLSDNKRSLVVIPQGAATDKKITLYSANPADMQIRMRVSAAVNKALNLRYFQASHIQNVDINFIQSDVALDAEKVSDTGTRAESWGPLIVGGGMALLLLLGTTFHSMPTMNTVVNEKASRIYEVLLSSLTPRDILWGKIFGTVIMATLQMLIWVVALVALILLLDNFTAASAAFQMDFKPLLIPYFLVNYVTGLMIFLTLYAGLSSMFDDSGSASSTLLPLYFAILLPFYTAFSLISNPANRVAEILSMIPLTSLYVMPARMAMVEVPLWQSLLALGLNILLAFGANFVASKIYRISVLSTGNAPSLRQVAIWLKHA